VFQLEYILKYNLHKILLQFLYVSHLPQLRHFYVLAFVSSTVHISLLFKFQITPKIIQLSSIRKKPFFSSVCFTCSTLSINELVTTPKKLKPFSFFPENKKKVHFFSPPSFDLVWKKMKRIRKKQKNYTWEV